MRLTTPLQNCLKTSERAPPPAVSLEQPQGDGASQESGAAAPEGGGEGSDALDFKEMMSHSLGYLLEVRVVLLLCRARARGLPEGRDPPLTPTHTPPPLFPLDATPFARPPLQVRRALEKDNKGAYDEFLQVMRELKQQAGSGKAEGFCVPAVIAKVTELFRGHEQLLAGFNQFLPPGYHISAPPTAPGLREGGRGDPAQPLAPAPAAAGEQPQGDAAPLESGATPAGAYPPEAPESGGEGADGGEDRTRSYLREVRLAGMFDEFLQTLSELKPEPQSKHAVYAKVTELFRGHERLLAGFSQFLPPDFHISAPPTAPGSQECSRGDSAVRHDAPGAGAGAPEGAAGAPLAYPAGAPGAHGGAAAPDAPPARALPPRAAAPGVAHADPDIDKATRYITKIHQRFGGKFGKKSTYRDFLKLLDDYNKNRDGSGATSSKGIKEVVEKVCKLFYGHQDLLKDFSLFLPDAYQQQAKEHIQRAVDAYERERAAAAAAGDEGGGGGAFAAAPDAPPSRAPPPLQRAVDEQQQAKEHIQRAVDAHYRERAAAAAAAEAAQRDCAAAAAEVYRSWSNYVGGGGGCGGGGGGGGPERPRG